MKKPVGDGSHIDAGSVLYQKLDNFFVPLLTSDSKRGYALVIKQVHVCPVLNKCSDDLQKKTEIKLIQTIAVLERNTHIHSSVLG